MAFLKSVNKPNSSPVITTSRKIHEVQRAHFTHSFEVCFTAWMIAKKEITRNEMSTQRHQIGAVAQQTSEHVLAINRNGVMMQ